MPLATEVLEDEAAEQMSTRRALAEGREDMIATSLESEEDDVGLREMAETAKSTRFLQMIASVETKGRRVAM